MKKRTLEYLYSFVAWSKTLNLFVSMKCASRVCFHVRSLVDLEAVKSDISFQLVNSEGRLCEGAAQSLGFLICLLD